jgi:hypothetical protein
MLPYALKPRRWLKTGLGAVWDQPLASTLSGAEPHPFSWLLCAHRPIFHHVSRAPAGGARRYERSDGRTTHRNGYRERDLETRLGTLEVKFPSFGQLFSGLLRTAQDG